MANKKITQLPAATPPLTGLKTVVADSNGIAYKRDFVNPSDLFESVVAGTNMSVDSTDPLNPIVNGLGDVLLDSITEKTSGNGIKLLSKVKLAQSEQVLSGSGAITTVNQTTRWATTGANSGTLGAGSAATNGQIKIVYISSFVGNGTLTLDDLGLFTSIVFTAQGQSAVLYYNHPLGWVCIASQGCTVNV